jgi:integrase
LLAERFLRLYTAKGTVTNYALYLRQFAQAVLGPEAGLEDLDALVADFKSGKRDAQLAVEDFFVSMKMQAPKTVAVKLCPIKEFLEDNDVELKSRFWRRLRAGKGNAAISMEQVPTHEELKAILPYMPPHARALVLLMASSGLRRGEALGLRVQDIDLDATPARVRIYSRTSKTKKPRTAFISAEAVEAVRAWLKIKDDYTVAADGRSWRRPRPKRGSEWLFPFTKSVLEFSYLNALKKAGLGQRDVATGRHLRHAHTLRKFFKTEFTKAVKNPEIAEALMGHEEGVRTVYSKYTLEDLAKFYLEGESALAIFSNRAEVQRLMGELEGSRKYTAEVVATQQKTTDELKAEVVKLREDLLALAKRVQIGEPQDGRA